ncbi:MAG TPA: hypothetical protein VFW20_05640 [Candidatus Limnocylindrales bacterium]|nr:hypothetical protein [Candidatus Limnocylindrales bacterium]
MTTLHDAPYAALSTAQRARLERFARAFDGIDPMDYDLLIGPRVEDEALDQARAAAQRALGSGARLDAARAAMSSFSEGAQLAIARRLPIPEVSFTPRPGGDASDRVRFLLGLERAVAALISWDELSDPERLVLLGPWTSVVAKWVEPAWAEGPG